MLVNQAHTASSGSAVPSRQITMACADHEAQWGGGTAKLSDAFDPLPVAGHLSSSFSSARK